MVQVQTLGQVAWYESQQSLLTQDSFLRSGGSASPTEWTQAGEEPTAEHTPVDRRCPPAALAARAGHLLMEKKMTCVRHARTCWSSSPEEPGGSTNSPFERTTENLSQLSSRYLRGDKTGLSHTQ
ncbi:hypothetical protein P7K49_009099 [Saguinus oedipus]|uniref:Uncharacterized protein n=1 Tax=Saguinus oedipus TaxID=9490 RepID=A0ABQ9W237_SAGOE|nr:hypothetical protein P7K49_009099 [Saguinus oedipus]